MESRENKKNRDMVPAVKEVGEFGDLIAASKRKMYLSRTPEQLKSCFQESIHQVGFLGFSCYSSICNLLPDCGILIGPSDTQDSYTYATNSSLQNFLNHFDNSNLYNDIAERLGDYSNDYLYSIEEMSERHFQKSTFETAFQWPLRVTPFLTIQDAPKSRQPLMHTVVNLGTKFCQPPVEDQLNIPLEAANGQIIYLGLLFKKRLNLSRVYAGTILTTNYHQHCSKMMRAEKQKKNDEMIKLGETQLACLKWAVAGKTTEDIAEITGIRRCTVRYHMEQARKRYGYTTMRQTLVRAAIDYCLDPLGY